MPNDDRDGAPQPPSPGLVGSGLSRAIGATYESLKATQALSIQKCGSPEAYMRATAPAVLRVYPGPWTDEAVQAETTAGWQQAGQRIDACARCPPHGGACEGDLSPARGHTVSVAEARVSFARCARWPEWIDRKALVRGGVPEALLVHTLERLIGPLKEMTGTYPLRAMLIRWTEKVSSGGATSPFVLTGGTARLRTALAAAVARGAITGNRVTGLCYTFGPRLAAELIERYRSRTDIEDDPVRVCEAAKILVFDACDPRPPGREPWKGWFLDKVDEMLWKRIGSELPTVIVSRLGKEKLMEALPSSATLATALGELDVSRPEFGAVTL